LHLVAPAHDGALPRFCDLAADISDLAVEATLGNVREQAIAARAPVGRLGIGLDSDEHVSAARPGIGHLGPQHPAVDLLPVDVDVLEADAAGIGEGPRWIVDAESHT